MQTVLRLQHSDSREDIRYGGKEHRDVHQNRKQPVREADERWTCAEQRVVDADDIFIEVSDLQVCVRACVRVCMRVWVRVSEIRHVREPTRNETSTNIHSHSMKPRPPIPLEQ